MRIRVLQLIVPRSTTSWEAILTPLWWSIAPNAKSPKIACFPRLRRSVGRDSGWSRAPWDVIFLPKVVVFGVRRGTISLSTCTDTTDTIKSSPSLSTQSLQVQVCARAACALRALPRKRARCLRSCAPRGSLIGVACGGKAAEADQ